MFKMTAWLQLRLISGERWHVHGFNTFQSHSLFQFEVQLNLHDDSSCLEGRSWRSFLAEIHVSISIFEAQGAGELGSLTQSLFTLNLPYIHSELLFDPNPF